MSDGTTKDVTREGAWRSSNGQVLTISQTGEVNVVAFGISTITFTYERSRASVTVRAQARLKVEREGYETREIDTTGEEIDRGPGHLASASNG